MSRDDIHKLLGGYATGTLTPEEQQALFEAALNDQELFDALAREQPLRDLLRDPAAKAHLLAAFDERPSRWYRGWGWWRPAAAVVAMAGLAAVAVVVARHERTPAPVMVAQVSPPAEPPSGPPSEPPSKPKSAPASPNPVQLDRLVAPAKRKAPPAPQRLPVVAENRPSAPAVTAAPKVAPATMASELRDAGRGGGGRGAGGVGGAVGGVIGGVPGAAPQAAPPPPAPKLEVQAAAENFVAAPIVNARALFYETPVPSQSFAPRDVKDAETGVPAGQQQQQASQGRALAMARVGAAAKAVQERPATNPGVRYRILRQADANGLAAAATIKVEFTPNDNGILSVTSGGRTLISHPVTRLATYTTEPLSPRDRELTVVFSRTVPVAVTGAVALGAQKKDALQRSEAADGTYVVGEPASPELHFTISLNDK